MNWYEEHYIGAPIVVMCYQYDSYGNMIKYTDESNQTTYFRYDRAARMIVITDSNANQTRINYEDGDELAGRRVQQVITPHTQFFYQYDERNRQRGAILIR